MQRHCHFRFRFLMTAHLKYILLALPMPRPSAKHTHLLRKAMYHCTADLLFDWLDLAEQVNLSLI